MKSKRIRPGCQLHIGLVVVQRLRTSERHRTTPVIMLTAETELNTKVKGLDAGADDYITKPFSQRLLLERIRTILRRHEKLAANSNDPEAVAPPLVRGDLILDANRHLCSWKGATIDLTVTEFLIVQALAARPGHVKSRDQLMDAAYGESIYVDDRTIDSHIKRLRKKFKASDDEFSEIETLYGIGYRYRDG